MRINWARTLFETVMETLDEYFSMGPISLICWALVWMLDCNFIPAKLQPHLILFVTWPQPSNDHWVYQLQLLLVLNKNQPHQTFVDKTFDSSSTPVQCKRGCKMTPEQCVAEMLFFVGAITRQKMLFNLLSQFGKPLVLFTCLIFICESCCFVPAMFLKL